MGGIDAVDVRKGLSKILPRIAKLKITKKSRLNLYFANTSAMF